MQWEDGSSHPSQEGSETDESRMGIRGTILRTMHESNSHSLSELNIRCCGAVYVRCVGVSNEAKIWLLAE